MSPVASLPVNSLCCFLGLFVWIMWNSVRALWYLFLGVEKNQPISHFLLSWKWVWAPFLKKTNLWRKQNRKKSFIWNCCVNHLATTNTIVRTWKLTASLIFRFANWYYIIFISGLVDRLCSNNISSLWWTWLFHTGTSLLLWYPNSRSAYYALIKKERNSTKTQTAS